MATEAQVRENSSLYYITSFCIQNLNRVYNKSMQSHVHESHVGQSYKGIIILFIYAMFISPSLFSKSKGLWFIILSPTNPYILHASLQFDGF